jgi:AcrR family transcriptional regulator
MQARKPKKQATRDRILEAATAVYAERGYRNARVRDICERANANIAAINYHFGDKLRLYEETLRYAFFSISGPDPTSWDVHGAAPPAARLHAFIKTLLTQLLGPGDERSVLCMRLVTREMVDPTSALDRVVDAGISPQVEIVKAIVREIVGIEASDEDLRRCVGSIIGQCLYYHFARAAITHMKLETTLGPGTIEALADHITTFCMAGLEGVAKDRRDEAASDSP